MPFFSENSKSSNLCCFPKKYISWFWLFLTEALFGGARHSYSWRLRGNIWFSETCSFFSFKNKINGKKTAKLPIPNFETWKNWRSKYNSRTSSPVYPSSVHVCYNCILFRTLNKCLKSFLDNLSIWRNTFVSLVEDQRQRNHLKHSHVYFPNFWVELPFWFKLSILYY